MATFRPPRRPLRPLIIAALFVVGVSARAAAQDGIPCPAEPTAMTVAYGSAVTCAHQVTGDTDEFTFAGVTGEVIVVNAFGACATITGPGMNPVDSCGALRNRIDAVLPSTGTFTLTTRASSPPTASYTLALERLIPVSPNARLLQYGDTLTDPINVAGDIDLFWFTGGVNDTITLLASTNENMPPCIEMVAPDNGRSTACSVGSSNQIQVTLLQAGAYAILVRQGDTIGFSHAWSYTVQLQCVGGACFTAPLPPVGLAGSVSTFATSLTWSAPGSGRPPSSYVIEAGTTSGATNVAVFDTRSTATTFLAPGIPNGTYFVRVKSRNSVGTSAASNEIAISGSSGCPLPAAPGAVTASVSGRLVTLQWGVVSGSTSYLVEAGSLAGASNIASVDVGLATQLSAQAPPGIYFIRIRARNACGLGPASEEQRVVVGCTGPPAAPANLLVALVGRNVTLSWPAATGQPESYVVEAGSSSGLANLANLDVANNLTVSANAPPGTYFVRVRARNTCGISGPTIERTVVVP